MSKKKNYGDNKNIYNFYWKFVDIFSYWLKGIAIIYEKIVGKEYSKEKEKFDFSDAKNILHIGCGSYPMTALILAENNKRKITTIDNDYKSVMRAKKIISKKNLNGTIKADIGDGSKSSLDKFDMIIVSGCSVPKVDVVEHIFKNSKPKTKIIVRKQLESEKWFDDLLKKYDNIKILDEINNKAYPTCNWKSVFLIKN